MSLGPWHCPAPCDRPLVALLCEMGEQPPGEPWQPQSPSWEQTLTGPEAWGLEGGSQEAPWAPHCEALGRTSCPFPSRRASLPPTFSLCPPNPFCPEVHFATSPVQWCLWGRRELPKASAPQARSLLPGVGDRIS